MAEDHLLRLNINEKGVKEWRFLKGFVSEGVHYSLILPLDTFEEKWVSGKRLVALHPSAREVPADLLLKEMEQRRISITPRHIAGKRRGAADALSREEVIPGEC